MRGNIGNLGLANSTIKMSLGGVEVQPELRGGSSIDGESVTWKGRVSRREGGKEGEKERRRGGEKERGGDLPVAPPTTLGLNICM